MRYLKRDPFARETRIRKSVGGGYSCTYCGSFRKDGRLYRYGVVTDGGTEHLDNRSFCSKGCREAYYG